MYDLLKFLASGVLDGFFVGSSLTAIWNEDTRQDELENWSCSFEID